MESPALSCSNSSPVVDSSAAAAVAPQKEREGLLAQMDPFLVVVLENSRHRLTVLRMELDIQRFMQNADQQQFEFQHLPTSYLKCAAHRIAQHYGLQTMAIDNVMDGLGSRVVARKTPNSKYPIICLSEVPTKLSEKDTTELVKIAIRQRPKMVSQGDGLGFKRNEPRTVEERKEEYDKARARIFNGSINPEIEGLSSPALVDGRSLFMIRDEEYQRSVEEVERNNSYRDGASRVAIFRDREKDRTDPDYDRSYERYVRGLPLPQKFNLHACSGLQPSFLQHDGSICQFRHLPRNQTHVSCMPNTPMNPYAFGCHPNEKDAVYMQWSSPAVMYSNSFDHFGHASFQVSQLMSNSSSRNQPLSRCCQYGVLFMQASLYQQHLSFEHTQNCL